MWQPRQTQDTTRKPRKQDIKYTRDAQEMHKEQQETQVVARKKPIKSHIALAP